MRGGGRAVESVWARQRSSSPDHHSLDLLFKALKAELDESLRCTRTTMNEPLQQPTALPVASPIRTRQVSLLIHDNPTEIICQSFQDRVMILVTQQGKIGSLVRPTLPHGCEQLFGSRSAHTQPLWSLMILDSGDAPDDGPAGPCSSPFRRLLGRPIAPSFPPLHGIQYPLRFHSFSRPSASPRDVRFAARHPRLVGRGPAWVSQAGRGRARFEKGRWHRGRRDRLAEREAQVWKHLSGRDGCIGLVEKERGCETPSLISPASTSLSRG